MSLNSTLDNSSLTFLADRYFGVDPETGKEPRFVKMVIFTPNAVIVRPAIVPMSARGGLVGKCAISVKR